jgi:cbb3-type cytochrome oxidase subunit 3
MKVSRFLLGDALLTAVMLGFFLAAVLLLNAANGRILRAAADLALAQAEESAVVRGLVSKK